MSRQTIKALGDWEIEVLGIPYGNETDRDSDGEYFTPDTKLHDDKYGLPPVVHYHGMNEKGQPVNPEYIGRTLSYEDRDDGRWYRAVLDKGNEYAGKVWEAVQKGTAAVSSGASHLARIAADGLIAEWPVTELSVWDNATGTNPQANPKAVAIPAKYQVIEQPTPEAEKENGGDVDKDEAISNEVHTIKADDNAAMENNNMSEEIETKETPQVEPVDVAAIAADAAKAAVKAYQAELAKPQQAQPDNDPGFAAKASTVTIQSGDERQLSKYDHHSISDLAFASDMMKGANKNRNPIIVKALAKRLESSEVNEDKPLFGYLQSSHQAAKAAMKSARIKADETNFTTNANYGDEWIGVAYSGDLWEEVRVNTFVMDKLTSAGSTFEFPAGAESLVIPLESTDPVWYKVAQAGDPSSATAQVSNTVPAKALGTANTTMTLAKMGSSTIYTGEMTEDSVLPFVGQLRRQIAVSGAEYLESALIDGDTDASATTNINDIGGTPAATDWFLLFDGFRKSGLITTTANSRDAGALTANDFLETIKLLGAAGYKGMDNQAVSFIVDPLTLYKATELPEVKTRDVFNGATIENGLLRSIYGYMVEMSYQMNKASANRLSNTSGLIDQDTPANNTKGQILAVRWPSWRFGFRRRMTMEVERIPRADAWEITSLMRGGLQQRDTEAAAISYNVTV